MKPCYGCKNARAHCAGGCQEYHDWMAGLKADPEAMKRQRSIDGFVLHRDIWRSGL